jgi:DNA replication and repair protein RecF
MKVSQISLINFRNIKKLDLNLSDKLMINGKSGAGKTSIIEASYILLSGRSFKTHEMKECIKKEEDNFFIKCHVEDFSFFSREISVGYNYDGSRKILIDGLNSSRKELMNIVFPVIHSPDNFELINGGPKGRRDFIDRVCFMDDSSYFDQLVEYYRFVKQKNAALKKGSVKAVEYLNAAAVELIEKIRDKRKNGCNRINGKILFMSEKIFPGCSITLNPYIDENTEEKLSLKLEKEMDKGFSLYGPHLDPLNINVETGRIKNSFSMGETYLLSFILKLSEIALYEEKNIYPVFFIDDIFVFLDEEKKRKLFKMILEMKNQVIMTSSVEKNTEFDGIIHINLENCR